MSAFWAACWGLWTVECFASDCIWCLLSLSVNGTQLDRVVLINEGCYETWSWNLCSMEHGTKGSNGIKGQGRITWEPSSAMWNAENNRINLGVRMEYI